MADLASKCRRQVLLNSFGEDHEDTGDDLCCDVCKMKIEFEDMSEELKILVDVIGAIGAKGEVKIAQWIRGSSIALTASYNKKSMSYGNFKGRSEKWW